VPEKHASALLGEFSGWSRSCRGSRSAGPRAAQARTAATAAERAGWSAA